MLLRFLRTSPLFISHPRGLLSPEWEIRLVASTGALLLAFSFTYWEKALGAKGNIYLLENLLLMGLVRCVMEQEIRKSLDQRWVILAFFLFGAGLAHHWQTQVLFLPLLILLFLRISNREAALAFPPSKSLLLALAVGLVGVSPLLYLPLRAHLYPVLNIGSPDTFANLLASLSRKYYFNREAGLLLAFFQTLGGSLPWSSFGKVVRLTLDVQGSHILSHLRNDLKGPGLLLALGGLLFWWRSSEKKIFLSILLPLLLVLLSIYALPTDSHTTWHLDNFLLPANWLVALLASVGMAALLSSKWVARVASGRLKTYLLLAFCSLPLQSLLFNFQKITEEKQVVRYDYGVNLLKSLPSRSVFFAEGDEDYFPLYYLQNVEKKRADVIMIPAFILFEDWGVENIRRQYPDLGLWDPAAWAGWLIRSSNRYNPIHRMTMAASQIMDKNRDRFPIGFSYFNGAFHRYYLSSYPSLLFRKSGVVLEMDSAQTAKGPWLDPSNLRFRNLFDCPSNGHPSLEGIWNVYQKVGFSP